MSTLPENPDARRAETVHLTGDELTDRLPAEHLRPVEAGRPLTGPQLDTVALTYRLALDRDVSVVRRAQRLRKAAESTADLLATCRHLNEQVADLREALAALREEADYWQAKARGEDPR